MNKIDSNGDSIFEFEAELDEGLRLEQVRKQYIELAELAGSLAHEVKNPLSVISINMDLLQEDLERLDSPETRAAMKRVETCQKQCTRLANLLKDFLRFTKLSKIELKASDLNRLVLQILDFFEPQAKQLKIQITRYLHTDLPMMLMEPETLQSAIINLVKNAFEAMPLGGQLVARSRLVRGGIALDLIDTGVGMDSDALIHMFDHFYTQKKDGSGLGLPIAKKIIEAHGGRINVQSEIGRGTQITLEFPTPARLTGESASEENR
ncbi:MAG TPA: ATP-binding protein [Pirellulaceae bacterium]|nr:ATP-binding protein [Pirellulaceae bacterium]HMO93391.1 ATP-binding protein [Pirellulaceae bacterium]HMP70451.1 ATP-binding protein [Pirellulaceae bacterium]